MPKVAWSVNGRTGYKFCRLVPGSILPMRTILLVLSSAAENVYLGPTKIAFSYFFILTDT